MKGYVNNKILYIFPQDAGEIPYVDPEVVQIAVSPDELDAFKAANESYADMMVPYNYNTITANKKVWADHLDDDIVNPTPVETYSLTVGGDYKDYCNYQYVDGWTPVEDFEHIPAEAGIRISINNDYSEQYTFDKNDTSGKTILVPTLNGVDLAGEYSSIFVDFSMPAYNSTINIGEYTPVVTYSLTVESTVQLDENALKKYGGGDVDPSAIESGQQLTIDAPQGYTFDQTAAENVLQATFTGGDVTYSDYGDYVYFVMPADNATISITEATPVVTNPTLSINGDDAPGFRPTIKDGNDNTISDGDSVAEGTTITVSIKSGQLDTYTFDQSNPDSKTVIYAYLDNVGLSKDAGAETITFTMPGTDAELLMTENPPL